MNLSVSRDLRRAAAFAWIAPAFDQLGDVRGKRILDLGCGHGMASVVLARRGAVVTACDLSLGYVREARARAGAARAGRRMRAMVLVASLFAARAASAQETTAKQSSRFALVNAIPFVAAAWLAGSDDLVIPLLLGLIAIPASAVYRCERGWPRQAAAIIAVFLVTAGVIGALPLEPLLPRPLDAAWALLSALSFLIFALGVFLSQFVMNYLMTVVPKR